MKVYLQAPSHVSRGIHRVADALQRYAPAHVQVVNDPDAADLRILHTIGIQDMQTWCDKGPYALIQYCLLTGGGSITDWLPLWAGAKCTWSYYDLGKFVKDEVAKLPGWPEQQAGTSALWSRCNFYYASLGVDADVFRSVGPERRRFLIGTSGYIADTECVTECYRASRHLGRDMLHLGPRENIKLEGIAYVHNVPDEIVAESWSLCNFVAGLRRVEGFELPALEGLACGARPICFDAEHYRQWFQEHAEYVREGDPEEVTQQLIELMSRPVRRVTPAERSHVAQMFSWQPIVSRFWEALS